jgi:hypothetical protein
MPAAQSRDVPEEGSVVRGERRGLEEPGNGCCCKGYCKVGADWEREREREEIKRGGGGGRDLLHGGCVYRRRGLYGRGKASSTTGEDKVRAIG